MDDAERGVAVLHAVGDDAQRDEVVHLIELDALPLQLLVDAVEALEPAVDLLDRHLRFAELRRDGLFEVVDFDFGRLALALDLGRQRLVAGRDRDTERQLLELVLDLAHPEPVRDRRVDVEGLLRGPQLPLLGHVASVRMLWRRSASFTRMTRMSSTIARSILRKFSACRSSLDENGMALILVTPSTTWATSGPKCSSNLLDGGEGVFDDVMQQAGGDGDRIQPHVGQNAGDLQWMHQVGLP